MGYPARQRELAPGTRTMNDTTHTAGETPRDVVFHVRGLTKVYPMGEVEVQALRGVDRSYKQ